jgi:hypothetical protein
VNGMDRSPDRGGLFCTRLRGDSRAGMRSLATAKIARRVAV